MTVPLSAADREDLERPYKQGLCDVFALMLHEYTGLPFALWVGWHEDDQGEEGDEYSEPFHAVVHDPATGRWLDITGWHTEAPEPAEIGATPLRISMEPASRAEIESAFTSEVIPEEQMVEARAVFFRLGLDEQVKSASAPAIPRRHRPGA